MTFKYLALGAAAIALAACAQTGTSASSDASAAKTVMNTAHIDAAVDAQPEKVKARYQYRHPAETLEFFGIEPGMTVVEALPGGGWYSKILLPAIGDDGTLIGADYAIDMWPEFGGFATPEFIEKRKTWAAEWGTGVDEWRGENKAKTAAFAFGARPSNLDGTADAVLFIRALHNLARFEDEGSYMTEALADAHAILKPGGIVGIVQHRAPKDADAEWADGNNGYLKQGDVIVIMKKAGFKLVDWSEINANPKDQPGSDDVVWRLPPSLRGGDEDPDLKAKMMAIGESDRMTLKFVKE